MSSSDDDRLLFRFWGKARPQGTGATFHPVVAHCLDVAAVTARMRTRQPRGISPSTAAFLAALHDIGKFSPAFQAKVPDLWPEALGPLPSPRPADPGHHSTGFALLRSPEIILATGEVFAGWSRYQRRSLLAAVAGHHGRPPSDVPAPDCLPWAVRFIALLAEVLHPEPLALPEDAAKRAALGWQLSGLVTLADWIGSAQAWFPYVMPATLDDLAAYYARSSRQAATACAEAGLGDCAPASFGGLAGLFPEIAHPTALQCWAETVALPSGPSLFVIEEATGGGKTEAAMLLAHRLMASGLAKGVFLALPTMATANAMFGRLEPAYRRLFAPGCAPSLALAHGKAGLHPGFAAAISDRLAGEDAAPGEACEPAGAQCAAWLADDRRRTLLAEIGVGTIDQALLSVLAVRHATLRQHGLSRKVLIIDEAHAFDAYMTRELLGLLRFHAALGGSAILLSATLPHALRQRLADAWREGLGQAPARLASHAYPLASVVAAQGAEETPLVTRTPRRVQVERVADVETAVARITAAAQRGAAVAWVRNTVDDVIAGAEEVRAAGVEPLVFHARFAMTDRLAREAEVVERFGPDGGTARAGVVVASQVIEQSLDLDFDLMVSDLAPVDLLIQRAGRLWRHERGKRSVEGPTLLVLSPEPVETPKPEWIRAFLPGTAAVYDDPALLWRGARALFATGEIVTPDGVRSLIEAADVRENVPSGLQRAALRAEGKDKGAGAVADMNLLDFSRGYAGQGDLWAGDVAMPTRLEGEEEVTLRLARWRDGVVIPYAQADTLERAWALSELRVAKRRVGACPLPAEMDAAAQRARMGWGRWERESENLLLAMVTESGRIRVLPRDGRSTTIQYNNEIGLTFSPG